MLKRKRIVRALALLLAVSAAGLNGCRAGKKIEGENLSDSSSATDRAAITVVESTASEGSTEETTQQTPATTAQVSQPAARPASREVTTKLVRPKKEKVTAQITITGVASVKVNGKTIVYPDELTRSTQKWPVISWANGTGCPTWSYTALLEALASGGYIVIADDDVMTADGSTQRDSIDYILRQNDDPLSVFYHKIDPDAIGVCGHSQGGRSCFNAAKADSRVRCLVSIAGSPYVEEARGVRVPSLILTGTNDLIVLSSQWCKPSYDAVEGRAVYASLKGAVHTTCMTHPEKVSGYVLSWFDACLKHDAKAKKVFADGGGLACDAAWQDYQSKND